jgi:hypothetical protein
MKKLTQEKIEQIIELYQKYGSLREVCRQSDISIGSAHKYTSKNNIINRHNITTKIHSHDERLIGLYVGLWMGDGTQYYEKHRGSYTIKICSDKRNVLLNKFIQQKLLELFNKNCTIINNLSTNQAYIKFSSKFIFDFVYTYVKRERNKTHSVSLKENIDSYSEEFLEGCLLGLALFDGSLQYKFNFNVTSVALSNNMIDILKKSGFNPVKYIYRRERYGWKDLLMIHLRVSESQKLELFLNKILEKLDGKYSFKELKYEK